MRNEDAINLEVAVWMSIVIMALRTSFHAEGSHRTINLISRCWTPSSGDYMSSLLDIWNKCVCQNHVKCDLFPNTPTSEIILPSYQHFLQYIQEKDFPDSVLPMNLKPYPSMAKLLQ